MSAETKVIVLVFIGTVLALIVVNVTIYLLSNGKAL